MSISDSISLYIHIPFCRLKCSYCDFNTYAGLDQLIPSYVDAICTEIRHYQGCEITNIGTIFFGGGTPSLLPATSLAQILTAVKATFELKPDIELSLESNPGTLNPVYLNSLLNLGFNRISIGAQSAISSELQLLDRLHTFRHVIQSYKDALSAGFNQINLDLMYGLPNQTESSWKHTLSQVVDLGAQHLSLYSLHLEQDTPMFSRVDSGYLPHPNSDITANMYKYADTFLKSHNYTQYEISNWSITSNYSECRHNLQYWQNLPYIGIGAGSHSWYKQHRYTNTKSPYEYIKLLNLNVSAKENRVDYPGTPAMIQSTLIDTDTEMNETMMLGLHLLASGVRHNEFQSRFGVNPKNHYKAILSQLVSQGLLHNDHNGIRLTSSGRLLANRVFSEFT
ncbi:MAG: coproporphyrinogen III oxidase [Chloroflexi bacterium]|nr:coproporphyrinogen III oxidase [Chloroflexota bacterium]HCU81230.1 coproporphyrinogen III oxidase [Chloroflexota bacterium]